MQSALRFACANDAPNSHSADKFGNARAASHPACSHNTRATSTLAQTYAAPAAIDGRSDLPMPRLRPDKSVKSDE